MRIQPSSVRAAALVGFMALLILPFVGKPPHIDEESHLEIAAATVASPLRPYDWWRSWQPYYERQPDSFIYAHPPLQPWILGGLEKAWGASLSWLRLSLLPFGVMLLAAFHTLARRFSRHPEGATIAFLATPATLIAIHQSFMLDLPYVALSVAAVAVLFRAEALSPSARACTISGGLFFLASMTKYPALALFPLLLWRASAPGPDRQRRVLLFSTFGLLPFLAWQVWTLREYGQMHLVHVLSSAGLIERSSLTARAVATLPHLSMGVVGIPLSVATLFAIRMGRDLHYSRWGALVALLGGVVVAVLLGGPCAGLLPDDLLARLPQRPILLALLGMATVLGASLLSVLELRRLEDRFLSAWMMLMLVVALFGHNFASTRYLLPLSAPLHLLVWRQLEQRGMVQSFAFRGVLISTGLGLTVWVAAADYQFADAYPRVARALDGDVQALSRGPTDVFFTGEWGFRLEMSERGYLPLVPGKALPPGALVIEATTASPHDISLAGSLELLHQYSVGEPGLRILSQGEGIGYYSDGYGLLPYGAGDRPIEVVRLWRVRHSRRHASSGSVK